MTDLSFSGFSIAYALCAAWQRKEACILMPWQILW
jgi:hypothetical protein